MSASPKSAVTGEPQSLAEPRKQQPTLIYFESDELARICTAGMARFFRRSFENLDGSFPDSGGVVVISSEPLLAENYEILHAPNLRLLALSEARFREPRLDGVVYSYLPPQTPRDLVERMVDNALEHLHLTFSRRDLNERLMAVTGEIHQLNQIGAALSAEHDTGKLLEMILTKSREFTRSDAGSLYLVEAAGPEEAEANQPARKLLRFKVAQNESVTVHFRESTLEIDDRSIAGYVALTGHIVSIDDAYRLTETVPYTINRRFDEDSGYRTKSILAVPMRNQRDEIVGVVQLLNAKREAGVKLDSVSAVVTQVGPYTARQQEVVASLASQAAVALENSQLYAAIQRLFEGFVRASVGAIESRDPTTSGHSFRVANLTVALAEAVDRADSGEFADLRFSREQMKEIRYASLLHDFGKVGVREEVLVKAKKLYPAQLEIIRQRFEFMKRTMESEALRGRLDYALQKGREKYLKRLPAFDKKLAKQIEELDNFFKAVVQANEPSVMAAGSFERLLKIAARKYADFAGQKKELLTPVEVGLLSIRKGSLDDAERLQIESHVVHSFNFLKQIPWTQEIRNIPDIARGHHEKLNGKGYPYKLSAPEIPVQTRMMTISDVFDALSAADRPYKRAVTTERALQILAFAVKDGELDPGLFQLFLEAKVYERWKIEPFPY